MNNFEAGSQLYSFVRVSGSDAATFLQGQLTQDLRRLSAARGLPAGLCNAQGRVVALLRLLAVANEEIVLVAPRATADAVCRRLSLFRLRARLQLEAADADWRQTAVGTAPDLARLAAFGLLPEQTRFACRERRGLFALDTGAAERCVEVFGTAAAFEAADLALEQPLSGDAWQAGLIAAGIPHLAGAASEKYTAHMLNLDLLGAISFEKGCYTGQEVIARTQHRGRSRRRLLRYRLASGSAAPGDPLSSEAGDAGEIVNVGGRELLAVVPLELAGRTLKTGTLPVVPVDLPYAIPKPG